MVAVFASEGDSLLGACRKPEDPAEQHARDDAHGAAQSQRRTHRRVILGAFLIAGWVFERGTVHVCDG